jgi:hypothetical protein
MSQNSNSPSAKAAQQIARYSYDPVVGAWLITKDGEYVRHFDHVNALSRLLEAQAGVPQGWKLVPCELTKEMHLAAPYVFNLQGLWARLLAATPNHPPSEGEQT